LSHERLAGGDKLGHNLRIVNWFNENFLLASMIWGSIATGYLIYGWKQKAVMPLAGGAAMMVASIFISSVTMMSLVCIVLMAAVYWLARQGY
jgi:hypothetical protein